MVIWHQDLQIIIPISGRYTNFAVKVKSIDNDNYNMIRSKNSEVMLKIKSVYLVLDLVQLFSNDLSLHYYNQSEIR